MQNNKLYRLIALSNVFYLNVYSVVSLYKDKICLNNY